MSPSARSAIVASALASTLAAASVGCKDEAPTPFTNVSINPSEGPDTQETIVTIAGNFQALRLDVDLDDPKSSRLAGSIRAQLGGSALGGLRTATKGAITAIVPRGMAIGSHDLAVTDAEGRSVLLRDAFRVFFGACAEAGGGHATDASPCAAACEEIVGCACTGPVGVCTASCGDGIIRLGDESCDDGNEEDDDGCDTECAIEQGWTCEGEPSSCSATCGDGELHPFEEHCDDGNSTSGDGCSTDCAVEEGFTCEGSPSDCGECGDHEIRFPEECDDGNSTSGAGCSSSCTIEEDRCCEGIPPICLERSRCSNGLLDPGEGCDDGNAVGRDGCGTCCQAETGYACFGAPSACFSFETTTFVDGENTCPGDGTFDDPFCSIGLGVSGPHDDIVILPSHYSESVVLTAGVYRLIGAGETENVVLMGNIALHVREGAFVEVSGLTIRGENTAVLAAGAGTEIAISQCTIGPSFGIGIEVNSGARLVLSQSSLIGNEDSALVLNSAAPYDVTNNFVVNNILRELDASAVVIVQTTGTARFANNTIADNESAGFAPSAIQCVVAASIVNSIVWGSTTSADTTDPVFGDLCTFRYSNLGGSRDVAVEGNFSASPSFVGAGNYHIREGSPSVDAGDPMGVRPRGPAPGVDFDGEERPARSAVDVGADEVH